MSIHSKDQIRIALIGDYDKNVVAHKAIPKALAIAGEQVGRRVDEEWLHTTSLTGNIKQHLSSFAAIWCVPASPYANMAGALAAIRFAREEGVPFLGTCGGFQHAVLEFVRNVVGRTEADNAEVNPETSMPLIAPLACALLDTDGEIQFSPGSMVASLYQKESVSEGYYCSFGFNPEFASIVEGTDMLISGHDPKGDPRVIELRNHSFFVGTAFQPERSALKNERHPLITAFIGAASRTIQREMADT